MALRSRKESLAPAANALVHFWSDEVSRRNLWVNCICISATEVTRLRSSLSSGGGARNDTTAPEMPLYVTTPLTPTAAATGAESGHGLCNTYVLPDSPLDLTPLKAATNYAHRASAAKRASPLRDGRGARRGVTTGSRSGPRDGEAAQRAKEHAEALRTKLLQAIAARGKWAFGTDPLALWGVKLCTNVAYPATYVGPNTNAAHNMSKIAIRSMRGRSVYPDIRGYAVSRAPPKDDRVQAVRHAAAIEAGSYEAGYGWTWCSCTS